MSNFIHDPFIKFKLMRPGATLPVRATDGSGAFDFVAPEDGVLAPGEKKLFPSGIAHDMPSKIELPLHITDGLPDGQGYRIWTVPFKMQGILFDRSGLGGKKGVKLSFHGLIDNDYRGEILLSILNSSPDPFSWKRGDRLCQIAYALLYAGQAVETQTLTETNRGAGGFGSTGR